MINFQRPAFQDLNNFCNKRFCIRSYCLSSELHIIATALETQEQADNYCTHKFYPLSVSHSSLAVFRSHVDLLYLTFLFCIEFVISLVPRVLSYPPSGEITLGTRLVRYNEDFVKSRFCSIHFIVTLAGLKKIVCCTEDFVI